MNVPNFVTYVVISALPLGLTCAASKEYDPVGPAETAGLETALRHKMGGYNVAFWPRPEKLAGAIAGAKLPKAYIDEIKKWLPRVLQPGLRPNRLDPNEWLGVRKLYFNSNRIIGRFPVVDVNGVLEFKARYRGLSITVNSRSLFPKAASGMTSEDIKEIITGVLAFPEEKKNKIVIQSHVATLAGVDVCYGKLFCEWTEKSSPFKTDRHWWSYIPFWYAKGKLYVSVATVEKGDRPHAAIKERWPF
jgi:hypothetical protein